MRVDVLGPVAVSHGSTSLSGAQLGGRRARVALVALALADGPLSADHLAALLWGDALPPTWGPALRGVIRGLRTALAPVGGDGQQVIVTVPSGYRIADGAEVPVRTAAAAVRAAAGLAAAGRHAAALETVEPIARLRGADLLAGEDADWLAPHRSAVDAAALAAAEVGVSAAAALGEHARAVEIARAAVLANPLDERAHRALIVACDRAGDRAGAVAAYERCRAILAEQLGVDPSAETVSIYLAALQDQLEDATARPPVPTTTFVGRGGELAALRAAVARPGLVTITGRGGVGKSRLATQLTAAGRRAAGKADDTASLASSLTAERPDFAGGLLWVSLGSVSDDALVAASVALALKVSVGSGEPAEAIAGRLAPRGRTLLVLDGCETVLDGTASLVASLLAACPQLTVLATSRVPFGLDGETVIAVDPLPMPSTAEEPNTQLQILADRVREGGSELALDPSTAPLLVEVCRRCDGLPLALELAAAQLTALPVGDLLDQLALGAAEGTDRLRAMARSSYAALDEDEATVFRRFSVLEGGVSLPLVRPVVSGGSIAPMRVVRILRELTARGLLSVDRSGVRWRYRLDDDLHRFARELLAEKGAGREAFDRLADAIRALLPDDPRSPPAPYQDEITEVLASVRSLFGAALDRRADSEAALELAFRLHRYWAATNVAEGRYWLTRLLAATPSPGWTRYAAYALGYLSYWAGDTDAALRELRQAVELFGADQDPYVARATIYLAGLLDDIDRPDEALDYVRRAIAAAAPHGTDLRVAAAVGMGSVLSERGDLAAAGYAAEAIALCRDGGSAEQLAATLPTAAMVSWQVGALDQARAYLAEARPMHAQDRRIARVVLLSTAAGVALADGDVAAAVDFGRAADGEGTELGIERELPLIRAVLARALLAHGADSEARVAALGAVRAAGGMDFAYPVAIALEAAALVTSAQAAPDRLATLLASAAVIRERGARPAPATLRAAVAALRERVGDAEPLDAQRACELATQLLS